MTLFTHGGTPPSAAERARLARAGVALCETRIRAFEDARPALRVALENGTDIVRDALFLHLGQRQPSKLAMSLGCVVEDEGSIETEERQRTCVKGVYLAGDAAHDAKLAIVAAAHGARAAEDIHRALREEDTA